ncbi:uncharacterized protein LDX57_008083 [Aspergillus melleus]|uniref:uncharacterized protein n=1 Tax=Aspergillus melleus TaxID=138277 RepID=UPI001E8D0CC3|nr:uncharacterized protein LDX57_008083 [Aspergillus melleus]KAH8430422.1 hypothetical protein LDX57_008083 [Aspergillus melleus]
MQSTHLEEMRAASAAVGADAASLGEAPEAPGWGHCWYSYGIADSDDDDAVLAFGLWERRGSECDRGAYVSPWYLLAESHERETESLLGRMKDEGDQTGRDDAAVEPDSCMLNADDSTRADALKPETFTSQFLLGTKLNLTMFTNNPKDAGETMGQRPLAGERPGHGQKLVVPRMTEERRLHRDVSQSGDASPPL